MSFLVRILITTLWVVILMMLLRGLLRVWHLEDNELAQVVIIPLLPLLASAIVKRMR